MLSTKSLITNITEVSREWIFEHYLQLPEKLTGQDVKIKSVFNSKDKNPSMCIYYAKNCIYRYKDFSSGKSGDALDLIKELFNLTTRGETVHKIIEDYNSYILINGDNTNISDFKKRSKYKVKDFTIRSWTNLDAKFWTKFQISSKDLDFWNVKPLESYKLEKIEDDVSHELIIQGTTMYGYFRKDGSLYKIYLPFSKDHKFIKVKDYIQGSDQITLTTPYLIICSSLKDVIAFTKLGYKNAEAIAPDSENTMIPEHMITIYKSKYKALCTLFDNDVAGINSMTKYQERYDIKSILLEMSKDISDSVKDYGLLKVKEVLTPLLKQALQ